MGVEQTGRRQFIGLMAKILGSGVAMYGGGTALPAFAQSNAPEDSIGVAWLRLACTGQSFVAAGTQAGQWQQLIIRHKLFNAGAETVEALAANVLDASYLGVTPAIAAISRGLPAKIYTGGHKRGMGLVVKGDSPIKSIQDIKGKKIATLGRGSLPDMQLRVTAKEHGLNPDSDFSLLTLPSSDAVTALARGSVDALMNCPEWPQVALTSIKKSRFVVTDLDGTLWHGPETQCVVVIIKDSLEKESPEILKKALYVHVKATRTMVDDSKKSAEIISKYEGAPVAATRLALAQMDVTPVPSINSIKKWRDKMLEFGFIKRNVKLQDIVELAPLREVLAEAGEKQWLADLDKEIQILKSLQKEAA